MMIHPAVLASAAPAVDCWRPPLPAVCALPSIHRFVRHASIDSQFVSGNATAVAGRHRRSVLAASSFNERSGSSTSSSSWSSNRDQRPVQRALGLDYGRRVVGLAVSTLGLAPRPLEGLPGCASAADQIPTATAVLEVAAREGCDAVVVGLPVTAAGSLIRPATDSQQGRRCRNFATTLASMAEQRGVRVFLADERGSTLEAKQLMAASGSRRSGFDKRKDSVAAAVILGTFFDSPRDALLVRPWRPRGTQGGKKQHASRQPGQQRQQPAADRPDQHQAAEQQHEHEEAQPASAAGAADGSDN